MASAGSSTTASNRRQYCADVFLRAWLCAKSPLPVTEMKKELDLLGNSIAMNEILKAGSLNEFIARVPDLTIREGYVVPAPVSSSTKPLERCLFAQMDKFTNVDLTAINRTLAGVQLQAKSGDIVSALRKREQLEELRSECRRKRAALDQRKQQLVELKSVSSSEDKKKRFDELIQHRNKLRDQVDEKKGVLEKKNDLDVLSCNMDKRIGDKERQLNRLTLDIKRVEEQLVIMARDGFSEAKQLEKEINENLNQHDTDRDRTMNVLDVIIQEKCGHSKAVLELQIAAIERLIAKSNEEDSEKHQNNLRQQFQDYRNKLTLLNTTEDDLRRKLRERQADLTEVLQLPVVEIKHLIRDTNQPIAATGQAIVRRPVIIESLVQDELPCDLSQADDDSNQQALNIDDNRCTICLHDFKSEVSEALACSHSFHRFVLGLHVKIAKTNFCVYCINMEYEVFFVTQ